jgi:hypothetical protein
MYMSMSRWLTTIGGNYSSMIGNRDVTREFKRLRIACRMPTYQIDRFDGQILQRNPLTFITASFAVSTQRLQLRRRRPGHISGVPSRGPHPIRSAIRSTTWAWCAADERLTLPTVCVAACVSASKQAANLRQQKIGKHNALQNEVV